MVSPSLKWNFPTNDYGQITGITDSGIETFKGTPIKSLAREICQNSLDASLNNGKPTHIEFKTFEIAPSKIPDYSNLEDALTRCLEFGALQGIPTAEDFFNQALEVIHKPVITCLRISDYNTTGLIGSHKEYNSAWCNLTKSSGASYKSGSNGGSFGIGKYAPFACSYLRTVFYSTCDNENICASQGVSRLTSFKNNNDQITQGIGFYGNERNTPMDDQYSLDPAYSRDVDNYGTDLYIVAFSGGENWQQQMITSILDGFLYAVYNNTLVVNVDGTIVSKDTLASLIELYKNNFKEYADEYYSALSDSKTARSFSLEITEGSSLFGKLTLKLIIKPTFKRRVAMIRQTGMKIKDKNGINGIIPFAGVLYIEGEKINSFLRRMENPQHLAWEPDRADDPKKAEKLLAKLTRFIKESLNKMKDDESDEAIDPSVGEYLPARDFEESPSQNKVEKILDKIEKFQYHKVEITNKLSDLHSDKIDKTLVADECGNNPGKDNQGKGAGKRSGRGNTRHTPGGNLPGNNDGINDPQEQNQRVSDISAISVRNLVRNKATGEYTIVFTPACSAIDGTLEVFMSAESQNYEAPIIAASCSDCPDLKIKENKIENFIFSENKTLRVNIQLNYHDYCSLEVKAYGNQI